MAQQGNFQPASSISYLSRLGEQLRRIEWEVESGRAVTIKLIDGDRQMTLVFSGGNVSKTLGTTVSQPDQKPVSLADNDSLVAAVQGSYSFDLRQADREISSTEVREQRAKASPLRVSDEKIQARLAAGLPLTEISQMGGDEYFLISDCPYRANDGFTITALKGFHTDLASIPRLLMPFITPQQLSITAPMFHDLIYRTGGRVLPPLGVVSPENKVFQRQDADELFLELMTREKVGFFKRNVAFGAVRVGGRSAWRGA